LTADGWKSTSNVKVTNATVNNFDDHDDVKKIQSDKMYWRIQYDSSSGDYKIVPMNSQDTQLDVISSANANLENVGIYAQGNYSSSKWRIEKTGTSAGRNYYKILSKLSYNLKGLDVTGTNVDIYDFASYPNYWEFTEVVCSAQTTNLVNKYADGNALVPFRYSSGFIRYKCICCNREFKSPEEQDSEFLPTKEFVTMIGLQKAYIEKGIEGNTKKADATLRIMDYIRKYYGTKYGISLYDFRTESGVFRSNNNYSYNVNEYNFYITINTDDQTDSIFGSEMLNILSFVPGPYGLLCSGLLLLEDYIENGSISYIDALFLFTGVGDEVLKAFNVTKFARAREFVGNVGTAWGVQSLLTGGTSYNNNYSVSVMFENTCETEYVWGEYRFNYRNACLYQKRKTYTKRFGQSKWATILWQVYLQLFQLDRSIKLILLSPGYRWSIPWAGRGNYEIISLSILWRRMYYLV
jgi:hypothetical protein